jgi:hypothetical protein
MMVCARPKQINRNTNGQLHSITGKSIEYPDGWGLYHINGIKFEEELFLKLTSGRMSFDEILKIVDVDQRNQALRFVGNDEKEKFLKLVNAKVIDIYTKTALGGKKIHYKLYEIPRGDIFSQNVKVMWYECPSTSLQNFSGIPVEIKTVAEAMAWKASSDENVISPEDWRNAVPLLQEA